MHYLALVGAAVLIICSISSCKQTASVEKNEPSTKKTTQYQQYQVNGDMNKQEFWRIIDFAHEQAQGDEQAQEALLVQALEKYSPAEIIEFECILCQYILDADDFNVMAAQKIIQGSVSDDSYLYFRFWLIGQGEKVFTEALRNPDSLAAVVTGETNTDFESLLYVATQVYHHKTGKQEEDESFPRGVASERGLSYDGATETKGEDWTPEQLPTLLPKLWAKLN